MLFKIRDNFKNVHKSYYIVLIVSLFHFFFLDVIWNGIDSLVFLTVGVENSFPQHTILYPILINFIQGFFTSDFAVVLVLKIVQNFIFVCSLFYLLSIVNQKTKIALVISSLYSLFIVQNGVFTEGLYVSFMLLFLSSTYKIHQTKVLTGKLDTLIFVFSFIGLSLARHTGVFFFLIPLIIIFIDRKGYQKKSISKIVLFLTLSISFVFLLNKFTINHFKAIDAPTYGRPAMHIIGKTLVNNPNRKEIIYKKWKEKAQNEDVRVSQEIIADEEYGNYWSGPRNKIYFYLAEKYPELTDRELELKTEKMINLTYENFVKTFDIGLMKQYFFTSSLLTIASPFSSYAMIELDKTIKEQNIPRKEFNINISSRIGNKNCPISNTVTIIFIILQPLVFILYFSKVIFKKIIKWQLNYFSIAILIFFITQLVVHSLTTVYVARYSVTFIILAFVLYVSIVENELRTKRKLKSHD